MIIGYINGQGLELHHSKVVEKSVDYLTADFQFMTNEWKGFRKWVHFSKGDVHYQIELKNDKILKTDHLNLSSGEWDVYIHGSLEREIITTNKAKLIVEVTGDLEGQYPEETPIPPYDYILNKIGSLEGLETEAKENLVVAINEIFQTVNDDNRVGIVEIKQTISSSENGGLNEITMLLTDGTVRTFTYYNGQKGEKGDKGDKGDKGEDYTLTDSDKEEIAETVTLNNDVGNAVKATANGEVIRVDDVSPIEHKVKANINGDGIDSQDVTLYRCGKNLFDVKFHKTFPANCQIIDSTGNKYIVQGDEGKGTPLVYSAGAFRVQFKKYIKVIDKVTVSAYVTLLETGKYNNYIRVSERNTSGATAYTNDFELEINKRQKISVTYDATRGSIDAVSFYLNNNKVLIEIDTLQVEVGDIATEYEPYIEESCKFSADGTAEVLSISPTMTLFTDTDGVSIDVEYNQDINDAIEQLKKEAPDGDGSGIDIADIVSEVTGSANQYPAYSADNWKDNYIFGGGIDAPDENCCYSPLITVKPNTQYTTTHNPYKVLTRSGIPISIREAINAETGVSEYLFFVPNNCDAIVLTIDKREFGGTTDINTAIKNFNSVFMLVEGETLPTEFEPYVKGGYRLNENVEVPAIGDKSKLKTKNKNSLVDAINELVENPTFDTEGVPDGGGTFPVEKTKLSEFENDVGYITASDVPNVPTKTSELENDSGFVTTQEFGELSDEIAVERARITNLATLSQGSTTGDAELIDARVGYDGTIYDNVGEAVRNQVSNITEMFAFETSSNLFNFETATANKKLDLYTGELTVDDHNNFYVSDFIPTEYGKSYIGTVWLNDTEYPVWAGIKVVFYDENKQYLGISSTGLSSGVTISNANAKYFRATFQCTYGTKEVYLGEGTTKPETFIPYVNKKIIKEEHLSITDDTVIADHTISSIKLKDLEEHKLVPFELAENLYNYENRIDGKQYRNGELIDNENGCVSEKIPAEPNAVYTVGVLWRDAWYYDATLFAYCFDANDEWLGQVYTTDGVFTTLEKTKFISVFIDYRAVPEYYKQACLVKGDKLPTAFVPYSGKLYRLNPDYISYVTKYISAWKDKKFVSYGDSITQQNLWQPYVRNYFEMEHACRGVGGSGFVRGVSHYYANADGSYNSKYTTGSTAPEGTTLCEAHLCSDERIALSIPEDADLILIAGGTNDHGGDATSAPELGEISYTIVDGKPVFDTTTFKNAVCATVYKIMERCPEAIVMLMTPCNTRGMNQVQTVNGNGLELLDYAHAIKECAEYMSIPCIDVYGESGLNQFNMKLNGDNLHPDDAGARKMARAVIAKLKAYEPRKTVFGW